MLVDLLRESPDADVVGALGAVADDDCLVLLGRTARAVPDLAGAVLSALDDCDRPKADAIAARLRADSGDRSRN
jgi:hypothetical protein